MCSFLSFDVHLPLVQTLHRAWDRREAAQISIHDSIRSSRERLGFPFRSGLCAVCTDCEFSFLDCCCPFLSFDGHFALVQTLNRAWDSRQFAQMSIHGSIRSRRERLVFRFVPACALFGPTVGFPFYTLLVLFFCLMATLL